MKVKCFAKINLYLNVSGKRPDGFHEIQSLFQTVTLFDTLTLSASDTFRLILSKRSAPFADAKLLQQNNLLEKVFNYFSNRFGVKPLQIELDKQIPLGAGLGGGSSDAAGLIQALNALNNLSLSVETLEKIGRLFGSDVPFFIRGGLASVTGRGEHIEPLAVFSKEQQPPSRGQQLMSLPQLSLILIYPELHISTKEAYENNVTKNNRIDFPKIVASYRPSPTSTEGQTAEKYLDNIAKYLYNAFEEKTLKKYPAVFAAHKDLKKYSNYVLLSGSGSCVFALFSDEQSLKPVIKELKTKYKYVYWLQTDSPAGSFLS